MLNILKLKEKDGPSAHYHFLFTKGINNFFLGGGCLCNFQTLDAIQAIKINHWKIAFDYTTEPAFL